MHINFIIIDKHFEKYTSMILIHLQRKQFKIIIVDLCNYYIHMLWSVDKEKIRMLHYLQSYKIVTTK